MSAPAEWSAFGREAFADEDETLFNLARLSADEATLAQFEADGPPWKANVFRDHIVLTVRRAGHLGLQVDPHFVDLARQIKATDRRRTAA